MDKRRFIPLLVVAAGLWAYHNSFSGSFVYDDLVAIRDNPNLRSLSMAWTAPPGVEPVSQRPILSLTLGLNHALGGLDVTGYHLFNLAIHLMAALVLFGIVRRTLQQEQLKNHYGRAAPWLAGAAALLWVVHPLQTQSVTYLIQRAESLMGLFYLATLYCIIRAAGGPSGAASSSRSRSIGSPQRSGWTAAAIATCALGMATKQTMVTAPLMVLAYDRLFLAGSFTQAFRSRKNLYGGLAATWLLLGILVAAGPSIRSVGFGLEILPFADSIKTQCVVLVHYLRLCFWPQPLILDYAWPITRSFAEIWPAAAALLFLLGATVWGWLRKSPLSFLGIWLFLILAPTTFLPMGGEVAAEHRMYLSLAAVIVSALLAGDRILKRLIRSQERMRGTLALILVAAVATAFGGMTIRRNEDYRTERSIWEATVADRPQNPNAHNNLAAILTHQGKTEEAIGHYREALRLRPNLIEAHSNLGLALANQGKLEEAIRSYNEALRHQPDYAPAHNHLGVALIKLGKLEQAVASLTEALRLEPNDPQIHFNLGVALERQGKFQEALYSHSEALRFKPDYAQAYNNSGAILARQGRLEEAEIYLSKALVIESNSPKAHNNLANVLLQQGKVKEAIRHYQEALRLDPDYFEARHNLEAVFAELERAREVIER